MHVNLPQLGQLLHINIQMEQQEPEPGGQHQLSPLQKTPSHPPAPAQKLLQALSALCSHSRSPCPKHPLPPAPNNGTERESFKLNVVKSIKKIIKIIFEIKDFDKIFLKIISKPPHFKICICPNLSEGIRG